MTNRIQDECPYCGTAVDAHAHLSDDSTPKPGDVSICAYCAEICRFNADGRLERLTSIDWDAMPTRLRSALNELQRKTRVFIIEEGRVLKPVLELGRASR